MIKDAKGNVYRRIDPPKKVSDWEGRKVLSLYPVANMLGEMPEGTVFVVKYTTSKTKSLITEPCECCGLKYSVTIQDPKEAFLKRFVFVEEERIALSPQPPEPLDPERHYCDRYSGRDDCWVFWDSENKMVNFDDRSCWNPPKPDPTGVVFRDEKWWWAYSPEESADLKT